MKPVRANADVTPLADDDATPRTSADAMPRGANATARAASEARP